MKSLVYAAKSNTVAELLNRIMGASVHVRKDKSSPLWSVTSLLRRTTVSKIIRKVASSNYFISIRNYFIKFNYYLKVKGKVVPVHRTMKTYWVSEV
jgi:hypothetical protein